MNNVERARAFVDGFNRRDWESWRELFNAEVTFTDVSQSLTVYGRSGVQRYAECWVRALSDGRCTDVQLIDAGEVVVLRFVAAGTNDGPFGTLPPTSRTVSFGCVELIHFDADGSIDTVELFYDRLDILTQLDHVPAFS
jgi:predicted ester cyclase